MLRPLHLDLPEQEAVKEFAGARKKAFFRRIGAFLRRHPSSNRLLSFEEVAQTLDPWRQAYLGRRTVPVESIVGSEGRYADFDDEFLPLQGSSEQKWRSVYAALRRGEELPPVSLLKVGDSYFVRDGNHRVSVARWLGVEALDAEVAELSAAVPIEVRVGTVCGPCKRGNAKGGITDMRDEKARNPEDSVEIRRPVQAFDAASEAKRLREVKTYEDHGCSVLSLFQGPSLRGILTAIAAGGRTGERRVAGPSTVHVLEGEVRFQAGEERHVLSAGGTLILEGNVPYKAEASSDAVFLHTLVRPTEEDNSLPGSAHPTEPAEGRADLGIPGAGHAS